MNNVLASRYDLIGYFIEIIIAQLLFFYRGEKKPYYPIRFFLSIMGGGAVSLMVGMPWENSDTLVKFIILLVVISCSVFVMRVTFRGRFGYIVSASIAGVAAQHIAFKSRHLIEVIWFRNDGSDDIIKHILVEVFVVFTIYVVIYLLFARNFEMATDDIRSNIISIFIVLTCIGVNRLVADHANQNIYYEVATGIYAIIACFFSLTIQFYIYKWHKERTDVIIVKNLLSASEKQYEQWKSMEEFTSIKIHDLKHMLDRIERLSKEEDVRIPDLNPLRESIDSFKPNVKTGNDVIDILLRNMVVLCIQQNIRFNVVSYTEKLKNFDSMSLYFLFANAIDNAREAVEKVEGKDKRIIDMSIKDFGDSVVIHLWNYFEGDLVYKDRLLVSKKQEEGHGYGLKSIQTMVDSFEGAMNTSVEKDCFHLNIILPSK